MYLYDLAGPMWGNLLSFLATILQALIILPSTRGLQRLSSRPLLHEMANILADLRKVCQLIVDHLYSANASKHDFEQLFSLNNLEVVRDTSSAILHESSSFPIENQNKNSTRHYDAPQFKTPQIMRLLLHSLIEYLAS